MYVNDESTLPGGEGPTEGPSHLAVVQPARPPASLVAQRSLPSTIERSSGKGGGEGETKRMVRSPIFIFTFTVHQYAGISVFAGALVETHPGTLAPDEPRLAAGTGRHFV